MRFPTILLVTALTGLFNQTTVRAQNSDRIEIKTTSVGEGVYMLAGAGGNIGVLVGTDGVVVVDTQFPELRQKILDAIAGVGGGSVRYVLNTNWHYDHVLGNELFRKSGAVIVAQEKCRPRMSSEQFHLVLDVTKPAYPQAALPEVTFGNSLKLHLNGEEIEAVHIADAHSDADVVYRFHRANVIHTGDLFFSAGYPYIDIGNGGSINGMIAAADRILTMTDDLTKVIPGHGPMADRKKLAEFRAMMVTVRDRIVKMIKEGKTLEEVVAAKPTADLDERWQAAMRPDAFVTLVYRDVSR